MRLLNVVVICCVSPFIIHPLLLLLLLYQSKVFAASIKQPKGTNTTSIQTPQQRTKTQHQSSFCAIS
eukprot:m.76700 g.76700  ORF g.76700 m.76700 type:complete len:67 (+) comp11894_c0_seq3:846-1046(+)